MKSLPDLRSMFKAPLLTHRWEIGNIAWPSGITANSNIPFMVTTAGVPSINSNLVSVNLGGYQMSFNGKSNREGSITWTLYENIDLDVLKAFYAYEKLKQNYSSISDITMKASADSDLCIAEIDMRLLDHTASNTILTYQLINCYFSISNLTNEFGQDASPSQVSVTVNYDSFVVKEL